MVADLANIIILTMMLPHHTELFVIIITLFYFGKIKATQIKYIIQKIRPSYKKQDKNQTQLQKTGLLHRI